MQIDTASWEKLNNRLSATDTHPTSYPPIAVYLLVHTLTAGADIEASYVQTESRKDSSSTVWRNWVITDSLFVHTDVKFAAADYDQVAEARPAPQIRGITTSNRPCAKPGCVPWTASRHCISAPWVTCPDLVNWQCLGVVGTRLTAKCWTSPMDPRCHCPARPVSSSTTAGGPTNF